MERYKHLLWPTMSSLDEINETAVIVTMLAIFFGSIMYIIFGFKQLKMIFKNLDYSFSQNTFILFKIISMIFLGYVAYEIVNLIILIW